MTTAPIFERLAERYGAWYEGPVGRVVFSCRGRLPPAAPRGPPSPGLEVGVGSGRFARPLGVGVGVDPAHAPLRPAAARGVRVVQAVGERLPFRDASFGAVLVVTLCFAGISEPPASASSAPAPRSASPPPTSPRPSRPSRGDDPRAGFVGWLAVPA
ncbi:MAG TPA: methyltransferase domain-containing protein [Actinomycetota bacterium]|nr:methyltransferase domain-containing protein [Actinomycetota bacterium]